MISAYLRTIALTICAALAMVLFAQDTPMEHVHHINDLPEYVLVVDDGFEVIPYHVPDSVFNRIAGHTIFKVNRTEINTKDPFLHELLETVLPKANQEEWALVGIDLRGAASPEGPYNNNVRLSRGRSKALIDLMSSKLDSVMIDETNITCVPEDYLRLLWMLEQSGDPAAPIVKEIIEKYTIDNPAGIKKALRQYDYGRLWVRLLRDYFPVLRSARVVLFFRRIYPERRIAVMAACPEVSTIYVPMSDSWGLEPIIIDHPRPMPATDIFEIVEPRQHALAVSTNLLYDAFYMPQYGWAPMPNVQLEYFPRYGNYTFQLGFLSPYYHRWSKHKFFQIRDYHLEVRRYFNPGPRHLGSYLGLYVNNNIYGIGLSATKGWEGEGYGAALKFGHVLPIGQGRWRLDMHIAFGGYVTRYDPYVYGNPITGAYDGDYYYDYTGEKDDFVKRNHRFMWFGPTEIGFTITYDLLFHKKLKNESELNKQPFGSYDSMPVLVNPITADIVEPADATDDALIIETETPESVTPETIVPEPILQQ